VKRNVSRRGFLRASLGGSLLGAAFVTDRAWGARRRSVPSEPEREALRLAIDEIIPREAGRPAASEVGGPAFLERRANDNAAFGGELKRLLSALDEAGRARFGRPFACLTGDERVDLLRGLERTERDLFGVFRDSVYEAYYGRPEVWKGIGYEFHAGIEARPSIDRFDESALVNVRRLAKCYREVR
jgi:hypothetical protein